jgi:CRISPR-associated protein Cmr6
MPIPNAHQKVPLMFRSQIIGRSQLHYPATGDAERWVSEWIEKVHEQPIEWGTEVQTKTFEFNWRLVTNGGQDDGMIRPVIGAFGLPFFPLLLLQTVMMKTLIRLMVL